jgi:hypothetical protein
MHCECDAKYRRDRNLTENGHPDSANTPTALQLYISNTYSTSMSEDCFFAENTSHAAPDKEFYYNSDCRTTQRQCKDDGAVRIEARINCSFGLK